MIINHNISTIGYHVGTHTISTSRSYNYLDYPSVSDGSDNMCSSTYDNDRDLAAVLNMEKWNMYGVKVIFYKTTYDVTRDKVFGEDMDRHITDEWNLMSYFQLPKENKIWSKFGIEGVNDFSIFLSKLHFKINADDYIPRIGDLILTPYNNVLYEIAEVKEESQMFMLSKQYVWELIVKRAKIENELSVSPSLSASPISKFYKVEDIMDIRDDVDVEKEDVIYDPRPGEKPNDDPFGNW